MKNQKKIISFSLWGTNPKYIIGALKNAELAKSIYPDWICRFYIGRSTIEGGKTYVHQLGSFKNVEIIRMDEEGDWTSSLWRFLPIADDSVNVMISRDTDSRLTLREKYAVDEWLKSNKRFHIMRDHPYHTFKILAGMWGAKKGILGDMDLMIESFSKGDYWQVDQDFLAEVVYPRVVDDAFIHDEFNSGKRFPKKRKSLEYIGDVYDEFDRQDHKLQKALLEYLDYHKQDKSLLYRLKRYLFSISLL